MAWRLGAIAFVMAAAGCASADPEAATVAAADPGPTTCRDVLAPGGSNVIETLCMTEADWEKYERDRERAAREAVRRMQGFGGGF